MLSDITKYQVYDKFNGQKLLPQLNKLLNDFSNTKDKLSKNYKNLDFDSFENYSIITLEENIIAFSSILQRKLWPSNTVRVFNRTWRNKIYSWTNPTFGIISQLMYDHQINYCKKNNFDFVFISTEKTPKHLKRWMMQANEYDGGWNFCDDKKRVCNGPDKQCVQWIIYKNIKNENVPLPL